jgi:hypothetical protein
MSDYQNQLEDKILELKTKLEAAADDQVKLRDENARFRSLMLTNINEVSTVDPIYIAQKKNTWKDLPIEQVLTFLELFQTHAKVFHEIAIEKGGKQSIKAALDKLAGAKLTLAENFRENSKVAKDTGSKNPVGAKARVEKEFDLTPEQSQIWLMLPKEQRNALKGIMKIVGGAGNFDAALTMLTGQVNAALAAKKG